jgi:hypothetical protein
MKFLVILLLVLGFVFWNEIKEEIKDLNIELKHSTPAEAVVKQKPEQKVRQSRKVTESKAVNNKDFSSLWLIGKVESMPIGEWERELDESFAVETDGGLSITINKSGELTVNDDDVKVSASDRYKLERLFNRIKDNLEK